jgi:hypothetical protein
MGWEQNCLNSAEFMAESINFRIICDKASIEISGRGKHKNLNFTSKGEENFPIKIEENA